MRFKNKLTGRILNYNQVNFEDNLVELTEMQEIKCLANINPPRLIEMKSYLSSESFIKNYEVIKTEYKSKG